MKKVIGLDLDEVFRAYIETFHHYYEKEFDLKKFDKYGEQISGYDCDFHTNKIEKLFTFNDFIRKNKYIKSNIDVVYSSHLRYEDHEEYITKEKALDIFRYEDYLIELYGTCPKTYTNVGLDLSKLIEKYENEVEFRFIVKDKRVTIGPSLFFISTLKPMVKNYDFVDNFDDVWNLCDVYVTANPDFIPSIQTGKEIILKTMPYNKDLEVKYRIENLYNLLENKFIEKITENE